MLNEELFLQPGFSGELFIVYAKIHPFVKDLREKLNDPEAFLNLEKAVTRTKWGRNRLQFMMKRVETMREKRKAALSFWPCFLLRAKPPTIPGRWHCWGPFVFRLLLELPFGKPGGRQLLFCYPSRLCG